MAGSFGTLTIQSDGSYTYLVDNANTTVQALRLSTDTLTDAFTYSIKDTAGLSSSASLTVTIHGANDNPLAVADAALAEEAGGVANGTAGINPTGNVLTNDTDVDSGDSKIVQGLAAGTVAGPVSGGLGGGGITGAHGTLTLGTDGTYSYAVNNADTAVQALRTTAQTLTDTFSYTMHDAAGATSTAQITVTIEGQNDNPTAVTDSAIAVEAGGTANATPGSNASGNVLTNDTDPDTAANGETKTVQGVEAGNHTGDTVTTGVASGIVGDHGTLTLNSNGSFTYVVNNADAAVDALNTTGPTLTDTFTYTMHDAAGATSTSTVVITIDGADDAPIAVNQGSSASPAYTLFDGIANAVPTLGLKVGASDVDDTVASLHAVQNSGPAHGTVTVNTDGSFSYTPTAGFFGNDSFTYHLTDSGNLSSNVATAFVSVVPHIAYIDNTASSSGEDGSLAHPFASIADFNAQNTAANHFDIIYVEKGTGTYTTTAGITLLTGQILDGQGVDPTYTRGDTGQTVVLHDFDNSNASIATISVTGGTNAVTLSSGNTIQGINITGTGSVNGIVDNGTTVGTLTIAGVTVNTAGGAGISLTHGGTVTATSTTATAIDTNVIVNHITSSTGTALNITNTNIGAGNVTFHDISANGAANGIVLNATGTSGHLTVTGSGSTAAGGDNSGGTIQHTGGDGIFLNSTSGVSLTNIHIGNTSGDGIDGTSVIGFTLANSTVDGANGGSATNQGSIYFTGLTGTAGITGSTVKGGHQDNISINDTSGTLALTVSGNTIRDTDTGTNGNDNLFIEAAGNSNVTAHVQNNTIAATNGDQLQTVGDDTATLTIVATGNTLSGGGGVNALGQGITISGGHSAPTASTEHVNFNISNNTITGTISGGAININEGAGSGVWQGQVNGNTVGNPSITDSGATQSSAIRAENHSDGGTLTVLINGNHLSQYNGVGINLQAGDSAASHGVLNATVSNNVETNPGSSLVGAGAAPTPGLLANIGVQPGSSNSAFLDIFGNTLLGEGGGDGIRIRERFGAPIHIDGYTGGSTDTNAVAAFEVSKNPGTTADAANSLGGGATQGGGFFNGTTPLPTVPPLLAATGGVAASSPTPGEMHLSQSELDSVVATAIAQWAAAGATAGQLALLQATTFSVADLSGVTVGEQTPGHITIDTDAAGHGWFVDPTPNDNSEFTHAANAAGTDLFADPSSAAAGHLDLLTTVAHELGHVLGLPDVMSPTDDLMYINLVDGERRLPDAADVANVPAGPIMPLIAPNPPLPLHTAGDFNGGGGDILWQRDDGTIAIWDSGQIGNAHWISMPGAVPTTSHIAGIGDFDGNGESDLLWRDDNGAVFVWDNGNPADAHTLAATGAVPAGWNIVGTGDFDGNGKSDILWQNNNGAVSIWDNGQINAAHKSFAKPGNIAELAFRRHRRLRRQRQERHSLA